MQWGHNGAQSQTPQPDRGKIKEFINQIRQDSGGMERELLGHPQATALPALVHPDQEAPVVVNGKTIEIDYDFQGGVTLSASGVKNGLLAAIDLGLIAKPDAAEILLLIREATQRLLADMTE